MPALRFVGSPYHKRYPWGRSEFATREGSHATVAWEARVTNRDRPAYKACPVQRDRHAQQMPVHVEAALWPPD
jgi:hypothetical protein